MQWIKVQAFGAKSGTFESRLAFSDWRSGFIRRLVALDLGWIFWYVELGSGSSKRPKPLRVLDLGCHHYDQDHVVEICACWQDTSWTFDWLHPGGRAYVSYVLSQDWTFFEVIKVLKTIVDKWQSFWSPSLVLLCLLLTWGITISTTHKSTQPSADSLPQIDRVFRGTLADREWDLVKSGIKTAWKWRTYKQLYSPHINMHLDWWNLINVEMLIAPILGISFRDHERNPSAGASLLALKKALLAGLSSAVKKSQLTVRWRVAPSWFVIPSP